MASDPPAACCYQGFKYEHEARGEFLKLGDFDVYISYPADKSARYGVLLLTDVLGCRFRNNQLIADQFGANGYFVMMPDLFYGDAVPLNRPGDFNMQKWRQGGYNDAKKGHLPQDIDPIVEACIKEMRTKYGCEEIGAAGYCFGAKYVVRYLQPGQIDVGYTAHPSHIDMAELKNIKGPLAIAAAEVDAIFPAEKRHESEEVLRELGLPYQINLYSGVGHGFAVRGDLNNRAVVHAQKNAFFLAVQWFTEYLRGGS